MQKAKIGVGIIGASPDKGWAAYTHVPALKSLFSDFEICAVATSRQESADEARKRFGVPLAFDNHADLIARPEVDLVVVSVRVPSHFELVSAAIQGGKAVYCEWPLGNGLDEAVKLAAMARAKGVGNWIGLQTRSDAVINRARDLIGQGYIGDVLSTTLIGSALFWGGQIDKDHAFIFDKKNGVTPLNISAAHRIDAMCYCLGEFDQLSATIANRRKTATIIETGETIEKTAEDQIAMSGVLENGVVASVHYRGGASRGVNLLWEINGTDGDLQIVDAGGRREMFNLELRGGSGADRVLQPLSIPKEYFIASQEAAPGAAFNVAQHYVRLAKDMRDGTHLCPTFDDALVRHHLVDAIEKSATTGQRQRDLTCR
jgi:predicted dehydrogenase